MKVLLLNQFFHPDLSATSELATDLAEDMVSAGAEVTALAARGSYLGGRLLPREEWHRGIRIVRVTGTSLGKASLPRRMSDYGSFYLAAAARAALLPRHDVALVMSTPPLVATLGAVLRALRGTPFAYWVQDVYPELAEAFGLIAPGSVTARLLDRVARAALRRADAVVVLGEAMGRRVVAKGAREERVHLVPNWADGAELRPVARRDNTFRRDLGLEGKRVVLYSGNMGRAHDLATLLDAARLLRAREDLVFLFVGDGHRRAEVATAAAALPNVRLAGYQPREALSQSLSAGDLHAVTQLPGTEGLVEPSKLYGAMAVGRPVLYIGPEATEACATVRRERLGEVVANGDSAGAAAAVERLVGTAEGLEGHVRSVFERAYDRPHRTAALRSLLESLASGR